MADAGRISAAKKPAIVVIVALSVMFILSLLRKDVFLRDLGDHEIFLC